MGRSQSGQQQQWPALASHKHRCNTAAYRMHRSTRECAKRLRCSYVSNAPSFKAPVFCTVALPQVHRFVCDNSTAAREALQLFTHCLACRKFYDRLKELREYHKRFPVYDISVAEDDTALLKEEPQVEFSGEETLGRYLDLHELHHVFTNAKFGRQVDYLEYLGSLADFGSINKPVKLAKRYREYLQRLLDYLLSFYERTQPLSQVHKQMAKLKDDIEAAWEQGQVPGWEDKGLGGIGDEAEVAAQQLSVDLETFDSPEELQTLGADQLKEKLAQLGLKCGGTVQQRAERLYALKGLSLKELNPKLFQRGKVVQANRSEQETKQRQQTALSVAELEAQVRRLVELLANIISDTRGRVEKKQAQTYEELLAEMEEADAEAGPEDEEEEEEYIYNPLKLPLGWDGKPIPYWLYKLHGLNQEFKCEICGNYSYWGRRAFERHFKEWRHVNGMKALGIPNNKDFYEVTKIEDALALWKNIQERNTGGFNPELDEELEDAQGNVYSRKVYEDLERQGLL
eukprot:GHRR01009625.1.p1 GENE.GHRR01009625.1~~GHRR01009625.1.p1  ORF type:complete len:514 (+),score=175.71 GHRR01009625.1:1274-2815(+)